MSLRKLSSLLLAWLALAAATAFAQQPVPGQPYALVNPAQTPEGGGKIEVIEFFWYGCPHCYSLEPDVVEWAKKVPADVVFRRVPAIPNDQWAVPAQMFYTLEAMNLLPTMHGKVFDAMHRDRINLGNKKIRDEWLAKNGVDPAKYAEMEKSFSVATKVQRAKQLTAAYRVDSVPRFIVNGKWYTAAEFAGGNQQIFPVVDQLVAMARKESSPVAAAPAPAKR